MNLGPLTVLREVKIKPGKQDILYKVRISNFWPLHSSHPIFHLLLYSNQESIHLSFWFQDISKFPWISPQTHCRYQYEPTCGPLIPLFLWFLMPCFLIAILICCSWLLFLSVLEYLIHPWEVGVTFLMPSMWPINVDRTVEPFF